LNNITFQNQGASADRETNFSTAYLSNNCLSILKNNAELIFEPKREKMGILEEGTV